MGLEWNLEKIYPSFTSKEFLEDIKTIDLGIEDLKNFSNNLSKGENNRDTLEKIINKIEKLNLKIHRVYCYTNLNLSTDSKSKEGRKYFDVINSKYSSLAEPLTKIYKWVGTLENVEELINSSEIIKTNEFAEIVITPIYQNSKIGVGIVWDYEDFSISMTENEIITEHEIEQEISEIREKEFYLMTDEQKNISLKTVRLFPKGNIETFQFYLKDYVDFLEERLPTYYKEVLEKIKKDYQNNLELLAYGFFGFEVLGNNIEN